MKKEDILYKWLMGKALTQTQLQELESKPAYEEYKKMLDYAGYFKAPALSNSTSASLIERAKKQKRRKRILTWVSSAAAVLIIALGAFWFTQQNLVLIDTANAQQKSLELPDGSLAKLNAGSQIQYHSNKWKKERQLQLKGEAYFEVKKGQKFSVQTPIGRVEVLGTAFNVKQRQNFFDVTCFEGLVRVIKEQDTLALSGGQSVSFYKEEYTTSQIIDAAPSWLTGQSKFKRVPLILVIQEIERQYDVKVLRKNIDLEKNSYFTGSFTHSNLDMALRSVCIPFGLTYHIDGKSVNLSEQKN
ncbi:FecR family protein [uncultured Mesonia sp.]|uniref:FecR family protein n=1 Tax=uncultured Mesonia sp. TaxID=399731 RepID=UPI00374EE0CB